MNVVLFLTHNLEAIAFYASIFASSMGFCALFLVWWWPSWLRSLYREFLAKCAVAFFRALAALSAIAAKAATPKAPKPLWDQPWASTVLIAVIGYLLWEVAGAIGDHKFKLAKEKTSSDHKREIDDLKAAHAEAQAAAAQELEIVNQDKEDAEFEAVRLNWLLTQLRWSVSEKHQRVRRVAQVNTSVRASIQQARDGLDPADQVHILLDLLASLLHLWAVHEDGRRYNQNFRVGLLAERGGRLEPLDAFDLATCDHEPFSSYEKHPGRYRLDNDTNPSQAVRCVREGRTLIVSDCESEPGFEFFHDRQRQYLKSMVAHPISGFCPDGINPASAALVIDTDKPGFFCEENREMVESLLREFAPRISLEYAISGLIGSVATQRGGGDERNRAGTDQGESRRPYQGPPGNGPPGNAEGRSQAQEYAGDEAIEAPPSNWEVEGEVKP
ncbi:hypothetical protein P12x_006065 (plasmid) [Tundrisphaera lichenicola]|uniref:hypothetical protein n=1 Tax=Tundrisphaera lichenicola TaxID=2029860 RepID=UPI003EBFB42C